jgi:hypothetical protein
MPRTLSPVSLSEQSLHLTVPAGEWEYFVQLAPPSPSREKTAAPLLDLSALSLSFTLNHPGTRLTLRGRIRAAGEYSPQLSLTVRHAAPDTAADVLIRTLAQDQTQPKFTGLLRIEPAAKGSTSYLRHHSLLLGESAQSHTLPSLEILQDDVRCTHAATLKTITEEDLFYLRSRGISRRQAETTLIRAFLADTNPPGRPTTRGSFLLFCQYHAERQS